MKSRTLAVALLACAVPATAQNLVPNGSFEEYTECPDQLNQIHLSDGWSRFRGSPDYFNRCAEGSFTGVPSNWSGWQEPATGDGYAGVLLWMDFPANTREQFGTMLTEPLEPEVPVFISFKVAVGSSNNGEPLHWSAGGVGVRFVMNPYLQNGVAPLPNEAAVGMTVAPLDTSVWHLVQGVYLPDSAYPFMAVGGFFDDSAIVPAVLDSNGTFYSAYVYIDDICVSHTAGDCDYGSGVVNGLEQGILRVYPVPFGERCTLAFDPMSSEEVALELVDALGQVRWTGTRTAGVSTMVVDGMGLPSGLIILRAHLKSEGTISKKLFHQSP